MTIIELASWDDFQTTVRDLEKQRDDLISMNPGTKFDSLLYRGLGNDWKLTTTLERESAPIEDISAYYRHVYFMKDHLKEMRPLDDSHQLWDNIPEPAAFDEALRAACASPSLDFFRETWYFFFIYLRQFGASSPLLDRTKKAHFAAFFAFDGMDKAAEHVNVYVALREASRSVSGEHVSWDIPQRFWSVLRRTFVQQAQYPLCFSWQFPCKFAPFPAFIEKQDSLGAGRLVQLRISANQRIVALKALDEMGINPHTLYNSEDALVRTISRRELLFKSNPAPQSRAASN